jgi:hypothetical protein
MGRAWGRPRCIVDLRCRPASGRDSCGLTRRFPSAGRPGFRQVAAAWSRQLPGRRPHPLPRRDGRGKPAPFGRSSRPTRAGRGQAPSWLASDPTAPFGQAWVRNADCASVSREHCTLRQLHHRQRVENSPASSTTKHGQGEPSLAGPTTMTGARAFTAAPSQPAQAGQEPAGPLGRARRPPRNRRR